MITGTPEVTCVVVDVGQGDPRCSSPGSVDNAWRCARPGQSREGSSTAPSAVVSACPSSTTLDWRKGSKCKVHSKGLPAPIVRTISRAKVGQVGGQGGPMTNQVVLLGLVCPHRGGRRVCVLAPPRKSSAKTRSITAGHSYQTTSPWSWQSEQPESRTSAARGPHPSWARLLLPVQQAPGWTRAAGKERHPTRVW